MSRHRARARVEVAAAIKTEARRQLAELGADRLSLRAVARELGMASSALYRYFPSRDDSWALAHPHEYALIYGSPVPGYSAPQSTTGPASRVALCLVAVLRDAEASGALMEPVSGSGPPRAVREDAEAVMERLGTRLPTAAMAGLVAAWSQVFGLISFEVFGQFNRVVEAREAFFDHAVAGLARSVGLAGR